MRLNVGGREYSVTETKRKGETETGISETGCRRESRSLQRQSKRERQKQGSVRQDAGGRE